VKDFNAKTQGREGFLVWLRGQGGLCTRGDGRGAEHRRFEPSETHAPPGTKVWRLWTPSNNPLSKGRATQALAASGIHSALLRDMCSAIGVPQRDTHKNPLPGRGEGRVRGPETLQLRSARELHSPGKGPKPGAAAPCTSFREYCAGVLREDFGLHQTTPFPRDEPHRRFGVPQRDRPRRRSPVVFRASHSRTRPGPTWGTRTGWS
jgi:hypothetical protein